MSNALNNQVVLAANVKNHGAKGDGVTDDSAAIQAAIDALPASGGIVKLGSGTYVISTSLELRSGVILEGEGSQSTVLSYTGNAAAIVQMTPGTRIYGPGVRALRLNDVGTGTIGLDLDSVSSGVFDDVVVDGFTTGIYLLGANGFCVYNRFLNVTVANATTGWRIGGTGSNSNVLSFCRTNICTTGIDITDSNNTCIQNCQLEHTTGATTGRVGIKITSTANALSDRTTIIGNRFEKLETNVSITSTTTNISAATSANPIAFTTSTAHGASTGNSITFAGLPGDFGTNLNGNTYTVTKVSDTQFTIAVDGSAYAAYTSGGTATGKYVRETAMLANYAVVGTVTDNGVRTMLMDCYGTTGPNLKFTSANTASATGAFEFERTVAAASSEPAFVVRDSNTGSGTPVTYQAETERLTGSFFRGRRGGVTYYEAYASGALGIRDGITAPGTVAGMAQLYVDTADGDLKVKFGDGTVKTIVLDT